MNEPCARRCNRHKREVREPTAYWREDLEVTHTRQTKISTFYRRTKSYNKRCQKEQELGLASVGSGNSRRCRKCTSGEQSASMKDGEGQTAWVGPGTGNESIQLQRRLQEAWKEG